MGLDETILTYMNHGLADPALDAAGFYLNYLGFPTTFYLIAGILYWKGHKRLGVLLALALVVTDLTTLGMKFVVDRPRPPEVMDVRLVAPLEGFQSFPSGHASRAFAFAAILALEQVGRRWVLAAASLAVVISVSRVYVGAHYPSDVVGGAGLGLLCAWATVKYASTGAGARIIARFSRSNAETPPT